MPKLWIDTQKYVHTLQGDQEAIPYHVCQARDKVSSVTLSYSKKMVNEKKFKNAKLPKTYGLVDTRHVEEETTAESLPHSLTSEDADVLSRIQMKGLQTKPVEQPQDYDPICYIIHAQAQKEAQQERERERSNANCCKCWIDEL